MPEFVLDHGDAESAAQFRALDSFTQGYIEAMFFTSEGLQEDVEPGHEDDLANISFADLHPDTLEAIKRDCAAFQAMPDSPDNESDLEAYAYDYDMEQAGRDFWYTRNGHGVGFWARDASDDCNDECLERLSDWAKTFGETDLYKGDDGFLHLS